MHHRFGFHSDEMLLAFAVWLCSLPLIAFVVIPFWGLGTMGVIALALLIVLLAICWEMCGWKIMKGGES
jgi:hypothetical protein